MHDATRTIILMSEIIGKHNVVDHLLAVAPNLLERSSITFLQSTSENLLLINCEQDVSTNSMLYLELVPIARLIQKSFGVCQIWIRVTQRDLFLHWSSQEIISMAEVWKI